MRDGELLVPAELLRYIGQADSLGIAPSALAYERALMIFHASSSCLLRHYFLVTRARLCRRVE